MGMALDCADFKRRDVFLWNVVPYYVSTLKENRNPTTSQIIAAAPQTQEFVALLSQRHLKVVVFCGRKSHIAIPYLEVPFYLKTFHPGAQSFNQKRCRSHILA